MLESDGPYSIAVCVPSFPACSKHPPKPPGRVHGRSLRHGLARTRSRLSSLFGDRGVDGALYDDIEAALLASDAGVDATRLLLARLRERAAGARTGEELKSALRPMLAEILSPLEKPLDLSGSKPRVILLAGVNGAGKTTSAGKLARYFRAQGRSVL